MPRNRHYHPKGKLTIITLLTQSKLILLFFQLHNAADISLAKLLITFSQIE